jgi:hypothetical protein
MKKVNEENYDEEEIRLEELLEEMNFIVDDNIDNNNNKNESNSKNNNLEKNVFIEEESKLLTNEEILQAKTTKSFIDLETNGFEVTDFNLKEFKFT